ncbi:MAG: DUF1883 domain-containing protein [Chelatococcus sp.]|nr:DUF1883 domain-containing protein [Chelatococcus sp. YT9]MBX3558933.1 DUF1883 domain-containing protein [Chelatococcus sp.]
MNFTHYNLGHVERGSVVVVTLSGSAANVRLMDGSNFNSYKSGRQHRYVGGLAKRSPVRLPVPHSGTWHVAVDMQGLRGSVRSGVQVVPGAAFNPLPTINEAPLRSVPTLVRDADDDLAPPPGGTRWPSVRRFHLSCVRRQGRGRPTAGKCTARSRIVGLV